MKKYIDLTNNEWKNNYLIGKKIITRPWNKKILGLCLAIIGISLITPFTNFFLIPISIGVLKKWG